MFDYQMGIVMEFITMAIIEVDLSRSVDSWDLLEIVGSCPPNTVSTSDFRARPRNSPPTARRWNPMDHPIANPLGAQHGSIDALMLKYVEIFLFEHSEHQKIHPFWMMKNMLNDERNI